MNDVEFLMIFVTMIVAFDISLYLGGIGTSLKHRKSISVYLPHFLWQILTILLAIQWWWAFRKFANRVGDNIGFFTLMLIIPMVFFLAIQFLFPSEKEIDEYKGSMEAFFRENSNFFYFCIILLFGIYIFNGILFLDEGFADPNGIRNICLRFVVILSAIAGMYWKRACTDFLAMAMTTIVLVFYTWLRFG